MGIFAVPVRQSAWGRLLLSVFVVAWMSATLQPCLMAMDAPPDTMSADAMHHAAEQPCEHCAASVPHPDNTCTEITMGDCGSLPQYDHGQRHSELDLNDTFSPVVVSAFAADLKTIARQPTPLVAGHVRPQISIGPSLNLQFCVFLI